MTSRARTLVVPALLALLLAVLALVGAFPSSTPAHASSTNIGNPWVFTETDASKEGLRINAAAGANGQPLIVYDYGPAGQPQPIFGVNRAGGAWVAGDNFRVLSGGDIYHGQVTISPFNPDNAVCVRNGQLWIGGSGGIWRCADLDGAGPSGFGWWPVTL